MSTFDNRHFAGLRCIALCLGLGLAAHLGSPSRSEAQDAPVAPSGLFEGFIVFDEGVEPLSLQFDPDGGVLAISALETVERESVGLGTWEWGEAGVLRFGYISYREGQRWICRDFDRISVPESCTLILTGEATITPTGNLSGTMSSRSRIGATVERATRQSRSRSS